MNHKKYLFLIVFFLNFNFLFIGKDDEDLEIAYNLYQNNFKDVPFIQLFDEIINNRKTTSTSKSCDKKDDYKSIQQTIVNHYYCFDQTFIKKVKNDTYDSVNNQLYNFINIIFDKIFFDYVGMDRLLFINLEKQKLQNMNNQSNNKIYETLETSLKQREEINNEYIKIMDNKFLTLSDRFKKFNHLKKNLDKNFLTAVDELWFNLIQEKKAQESLIILLKKDKKGNRDESEEMYELKIIYNNILDDLILNIIKRFQEAKDKKSAQPNLDILEQLKTNNSDLFLYDFKYEELINLLQEQRTNFKEQIIKKQLEVDLSFFKKINESFKVYFFIKNKIIILTIFIKIVEITISKLKKKSLNTENEIIPEEE
jgi:hypothetical protein